MVLTALRTGNLLNISDLARDTNLAQPTAHRYINLLELSFLVNRVLPFFSNKGIRLVKTPKIFWLDTGLAAHLAGIFSAENIKTERIWGQLLETFVYNELKNQVNQIIPIPNIYFWRTKNQIEVDFVIEHGQNLFAIEAKASQTIKSADIDNLKQFINFYPQTKLGIILYNGPEPLQLSSNIFALPISCLWL